MYLAVGTFPEKIEKIAKSIEDILDFKIENFESNFRPEGVEIEGWPKNTK